MELSSALEIAIEKYLAGTATPLEQKLVNEWYHSFNDEEIELPVTILELRTKVAERLWGRITETINAEQNITGAKIVIHPSKKKRRWVVAASFLLLVSFAAFFFFYHSSKQQPVVAKNVQSLHLIKNDVAPGGDRAMLTLSDGSQVMLDSASNGTITQQGNSKVVKLADGQLTYLQPTGNQSRPGGTAILYNTMSTPRGGQYKLRLADGTDVWLNAASSIRYPTDFKDKERRVEISGEAYFEVAHQQSPDGKQIPFIVDILPSAQHGKSAVEVLGTHFNINAYPDEFSIKTTLLEGSVKVSRGAATQIISPGQQATINDWADNAIINITNNADVDEAVAWKNGLFQFNKTDIQTLMRQLARWYDIDVSYHGPVPTLLTTGKAPRDISLNSMLKILALSDVHFSIEGKKVTVMP